MIAQTVRDQGHSWNATSNALKNQTHKQNIEKPDGTNKRC